jgi:hypothetical protein
LVACNKERISAIVTAAAEKARDAHDLAVILSKLPKGVAKHLYKDAEVAEILARHGIAEE